MRRMVAVSSVLDPRRRFVSHLPVLEHQQVGILPASGAGGGLVPVHVELNDPVAS